MKHRYTLLTGLWLSVFGNLYAQYALYESGKLFVKFDNDCSFEWQPDDPIQNKELQNSFPDLYQLLQQYQATALHRAFKLPHPLLRQVYVLRFNPSLSAHRFTGALQQLNYVRYAEQVPQYHLFDCTPSDALFAQQWALTNTYTPAAWELLTANSCNFANIPQCQQGVVLALVDDAVLTTHQDLLPNLWVNPGEIPANGIDDDGNGYIDDINGWDAALNDNNPYPDVLTDTHGTHCAGIAAAATNNGLGIASPAGSFVQLMSVKIGTMGALTAPFAGVEYAIASGANVISMSWGGGGFSQTYQNLFNVAHEQGIVCVAAAGNDHVAIPMYPASYNHVISVAATNSANQLAGFSNYGATIDICAPGVDIMSCLADNNSAYGPMSGTSMACPLVSSVCAMMLYLNPALTPDAALACLQNNAININAQNPLYVGQIGAGLINAEAVFTCLQSPPLVQFGYAYPIYCPGEPIALTNQTQSCQITQWQWTFAGGAPATSNLQNPVVSYASSGNYTITLSATNTFGTASQSQNISIGTPTATLSGGGNIVAGSTLSLQVTFNGSPPYSITYSDGANTYTLTNITQSPYFFSVTPADTTTYTLLSAGNAYCAANVTGQAVVNVLPVSSNEDMCKFGNIYGDAGNSWVYFLQSYNPVTETVHLGSGSPHLSVVNTATGNVVTAKNYPGLTYPGIHYVTAPNGDLIGVNQDPWGPDAKWYANRIDAAGNLIWAVRYEGAGRQVSPRIVPSLGDTYFIAGWYNNTGGTSDDFGVLRIDGAGNILNSLALNYGDDQMGNITPDGLGGLYMAGEIEHDSTITFIHLSSALSVLQMHQYKPVPAYYSEGRSVIRTSDGGYVLTVYRNTGGSNQYAVLLKFNTTLNIQWATRYFPSGAYGYCYPFDIVEDASGNLYVSGEVSLSSTTGPYRAYFAKFSPSGNLISAKVVSNAAGNPVNARYGGIQYNPNSAFAPMILAANLTGAPFGGNDFILIRTAEDMEDCLLTDYTLTAQPEIWTQLPLNMSTSTINLTPQPLASASADTPLNRQSECLDCVVNTCAFTCSFTLPAAPLCSGSSFTFVPQCTANAYLWMVNNSQQTEGNPFTYTFPDAGTYTITLYANDGNCTAVAQNEVTIVAATGSAGSNLILCEGESGNLTASGGTNYVWSPASGLNNPFIPNPTITPTQSGTWYVTISNAAGCAVTDSVQVWIAPPPVLLPTQLDTALCFGDTLSLQLWNGSPISDYNYLWTPSTGLSCTTCPNPWLNTTQSNVYTLAVSNSFGCTALQTFTVNIVVNPTVWDTLLLTTCNPLQAGVFTDTLSCDSLLTRVFTLLPSYADTLYLTTCNPTEEGIFTDVFLNQYGCDSLLTTITTLLPSPQTTISLTTCNTAEVGSVTLTLPAINGCDSLITTITTLSPDCPDENGLLIPNAFSPNADGINDLFFVRNPNIATLYLAVYNRWGQRVFETHNPADAWNGTFKGANCELGVYVYYATGTFANGNAFSVKGNVTLLR
ncbi:MAG TPA: S8 family serine peptidase [Chitinophagales bacterium]|nr:S8 family serine peptidase [Chitinophagales bacterium]HRK28778.1 S8 family serine peptidase [Chitinophagales bacterium]